MNNINIHVFKTHPYLFFIHKSFKSGFGAMHANIVGSYRSYPTCMANNRKVIKSSQGSTGGQWFIYVMGEPSRGTLEYGKAGRGK